MAYRCARLSLWGCPQEGAKRVKRVVRRREPRRPCMLGLARMMEVIQGVQKTYLALRELDNGETNTD